MADMPRYYFHVRDSDGDVSRDTEGQELAHLEAARLEAISANREILGEKLLHGGSIDGRIIEITDEKDTVLATVGADDVLFLDGHYQTYSDDVTKSAPVTNPIGVKPPAE
jgi:hypothetical protein